MERFIMNENEINILRFAGKKLHDGSRSSIGDKFKGNYKDSVITLPMLITERVVTISQYLIKNQLDSLEEKQLIYRLKGFESPSLYLNTKNAINLLKKLNA